MLKHQFRREIQRVDRDEIQETCSCNIKNNEWKVYDVVIDSLSLVANYRTSFNQEIKKSLQGQK